MTDKPEADGYGIQYLAGELEMSPQNVRNALRRLGVPKNDNRYNWSRKSEADAVVKRIETETKAGKGEKPAKSEKPAKAAKGDAADKPAKKGASTSKAAEKAAEKRAEKSAKKGADKPAKGADKKAAKKGE